MAQRIPITQGNDFEVRLRPILMDGTIVDASLLTDRVVKVKHGTTETTYTSTVDEDYICIAFDSTLQLGDYSVKITAKLGDQDVAANYGNLFSIVPFGMATPIVPVKGDLVIIGVSDDETEAYRQALVDAKNNYNTAAEALEDAKDELEEQAEALTDIAKESTLNNPTYGLQAIKTAIGNIPGGGGGGGGVSKAEVQDIIDEQTDTLEDDIDDVLTAATAAKTAAEAIVIPTDYAKAADIPTDYAKSSDIPTDYAKQSNVVAIAQELNKIGSPAEGQPSTLFEAIAEGGGGGGDIDALTEMVEGLTTKKNAAAGITYSDTGRDYGGIDILLYRNNILEIDDNYIKSIDNAQVFGICPNVTKITLREVKTLVHQTFYNKTLLTEIRMPKLDSTTSQVFYGCTSLKILDISNLRSVEGINGYYFYNCNNLIDLWFGKALVSSNNYLLYWNPTYALLSDSTSLVDDDEEFASNLEKLLYNIRTHIAAQLPDRTGLSALTLTFHANIKAAINADAATAAAFTNKNWTIA